MDLLKHDIIQWIQDWFELNGDESTKAVVGVSGGKDSSIVAALCVEALGRSRVLGVLMPHGKQSDISDSYQLINHLGIESVEVNIEQMYHTAKSTIEENIGVIKNNLVKGNMQSRLRMSILYAVSQEHGGRVSNNCNLSERFVGYLTIYGDGAGDFSPLSNLSETVVTELGKELGLPENLYRKEPIDGLENNVVDGKEVTDEEVMGFTYKQLDEYIENGYVEGNSKVTELIENLHNHSQFKRDSLNIPSFKPKSRLHLN